MLGLFTEVTLHPDQVQNHVMGSVFEELSRPEPDSDLRDNENVPLNEDVASYFEREVALHVPDAWVSGIESKKGRAIVTDESNVRVGHEIPNHAAILQVQATAGVERH